MIMFIFLAVVGGILVSGGVIYLLINYINFGEKPKGHINSCYNNLNRKFMEDNINEMNRQAMEQMEMNQQFATQEAIKSVTPFEHGGYDMTQGNSFNDINNMF